MSNFWQKLNKPFFCLAPMEEVTDVAFREMFAKYSSNHPVSLREPPLLEKEGNAPQLSSDTLRSSPPAKEEYPALAGGGGNPFVMYTEFVNVDGLTHPEGYKRLSLDLKYTEIQRPIVAQIWGRSPIKFEEAAKIVADLGFDGIDINMGCPQDKEIGQGTCAALIKEPALAVEIIKATKRGAGVLPVSVKTRIGYNQNTLSTWLRQILTTEPVAVAIHGRTKQQKSKVPADWSAIAEAVQIRDAEKSPALIIGNGDIKSHAEGLLRVKETRCDGVMVGRGAFGNPWFFRADDFQPTIKERLSVMLEHAELFQKEFSGVKNFVVMRKHFKAYASGFDGAAELRARLMETRNLEETNVIVNEFLNSINNKSQ